MSQRNRRWLAVAGLMAALVLTVPAPSQALVWPGSEMASLVGRAWSWLEGMGIVRRAPMARRPAIGKQGSMIDPDGKPTTNILPTPPGASDPDGTP